MSEPEPVQGLNPAAMWIVGGAILMATVAYPVVATVLVLTRAFPVTPEGGASGLQDVYGMYFLAVGAVLYALSFTIRRWMSRNPTGQGGPAGARFRAVIVAMALSEAAGVVGLLYTLLTGRLGIAWALWALAISGCILHFPTRGTVTDPPPDGS